MKRAKFIFKDSNFLEYFIYAIMLLMLSGITFGLFFPYFCYWNVRYFCNKIEIEFEENKEFEKNKN